MVFTTGTTLNYLSFGGSFFLRLWWYLKTREEKMWQKHTLQKYSILNTFDKQTHCVLTVRPDTTGALW